METVSTQSAYQLCWQWKTEYGCLLLKNLEEQIREKREEKRAGEESNIFLKRYGPDGRKNVWWLCHHKNDWLIVQVIYKCQMLKRELTPDQALMIKSCNSQYQNQCCFCRQVQLKESWFSHWDQCWSRWMSHYRVVSCNWEHLKNIMDVANKSEITYITYN